MKKKSKRRIPYKERLRTLGHRGYVGGTTPEFWHEIGKLQYHLLVSEGLQSSHKLLDIACGSLRLGQWVIPMLNAGNYYGLEGNEELLKLGAAKEISPEVLELKTPNFSYNYDFDFSFIDTFDFAIAQSLFTHLIPADIEKCFSNLRPHAHTYSKFYYTRFIPKKGRDNTPLKDSDSHESFRYPHEQFVNICNRTGWKTEELPIRHPRGQKFALATPL